MTNNQIIQFASFLFLQSRRLCVEAPCRFATSTNGNVESLSLVFVGNIVAKHDCCGFFLEDVL